MNSEIRKDEILKAAMAVAEQGNYLTIQRVEVATKAGCAPSLINKYFSTMNQLRRAMMRLAAKGGYNTVLAQGLSNKDPQAIKARPEIKRLAGQSLL